MLKRRFLLFILLLSRISLSQNNVSDSLLRVFDVSESNEVQINALLSLSKYHNSDFEKSITYSERALELSNSINDVTLLADCLTQKAVLFFDHKQYDSSFLNNELALVINDSTHQRGKLSRNLYIKGRIIEQSHHLDSAIQFIKRAIILTRSGEFEMDHAEYNLYMGSLENRRGKKHLALDYTKDAYDFYKQSGDLEKTWQSLNDFGIIYDDLGLYPKALEYYIEAFGIVEELNDHEGKFALGNNIGLLFHNMGKLEKAKDYYNKSYEVSVDMNSAENESLILNNLASVFADLGDTLKSLKTSRRTYVINSETGNTCDLAYSCEGIGEMLMWLGRYDSSKYYFEKGIKVAVECENHGSLVSINRNIGLLNMYQKDYSNAQIHLLKSLQMSRQHELKLETIETAKCLYEFHTLLRNYKKALNFHVSYTTLKDSLFNAKSIEKIDRLSQEYGFKKDIMTLEFEKKTEEIKLNKEIKQKKAYQNSMIVVLVLIILLAATLGRSYYLMQNHNKKLTTINEEKSTLMGVVAHDLRSPLNNIKGLMSLVKMESSNLTVEQRHYFNLVDETMDRMKDMIDRVLDKSAVDDMKVNLNLKKVDLGGALNIVGNNFIGIAEKKNIKIHFNVADDLHFALVDYNYMIQVYENLLSNAIKFSEPDKNIYLKAEFDGTYEVITIKDEGQGLSEDDQKKLFSKFQKLSAKPTNNEESTGLGLSIVKKFIDAMEGQIRCESVLGEGASFIISFMPFVDEEIE